MGNQHRLTLTMSPKEDYLEKQEEVLKNLEDSLVKKLSPEARNKAIEQGKQLEEMQSEKDTDEKLKCLPTLTIQDIPEVLPKQEGIKDVTVGNIKGMASVQPTNEVLYMKMRLNTDMLDEAEHEILPLFSMVLTSMGAKDKSYR